MKRFRWNRGMLYRHAVLALTLLCLGLVLHEIFGNHGWLALRRQKREYESLEHEINRLKQENQNLEEQVKALRSDPKAIEQQAREQLHLARPGEIILTLPEKNPKPQASNPSAP